MAPTHSWRVIFDENNERHCHILLFTSCEVEEYLFFWLPLHGWRVIFEENNERHFVFKTIPWHSPDGTHGHGVWRTSQSEFLELSYVIGTILWALHRHTLVRYSYDTYVYVIHRKVPALKLFHFFSQDENRKSRFINLRRSSSIYFIQQLLN